jgi:hypothetical protein
MWVLHQPNFKPTQMGQSVESVSVSTLQLVESQPGVWVPKDEAN